MILATHSMVLCLQSRRLCARPSTVHSVVKASSLFDLTFTKASSKKRSKDMMQRYQAAKVRLTILINSELYIRKFKHDQKPEASNVISGFNSLNLY